MRVLMRLGLNALSAVALLYAGLLALCGGALLGRGMDWVSQLTSRETPRSIALPNLNVLSWSTASLLYFSTAALILAALAVRSEMKRRRRDIPNVYFDETTFAELLMSPSKPRVETPPFQALVASMDLLDEALLGLSTEPIVYGMLAPRIRALFQRRQSITRDPMGIDRADLSGIMADLTGWLARRSWRLTAAVRRPIALATLRLHRPVVNALVSAAESFVLRILSSAAFGVPPQEFSDSSVVVKRDVNVPAYFTEAHCDVSRWSLDASKQGHVMEPVDVGRYAFLADDGLLEALAARSPLCGELAKAERQLVTRYRDYPDHDGSGLLPRLRRISVTLEHRIGDLVSGFGHVRYNSMPQVIDMIAQFITTGQVPAMSDVGQRAKIRTD